MKIGIYSLPFHSNYGGILQSYALETILKQMGHETYVFNQSWLDHIGKKDKLKRVMFKVYNLFASEKRFADRDALNLSISELKRFWSTHITNLVNFNDYCEIKEYNLDAIVVGSDQIWRKGYCKDTREYFLGFTNGWCIKRIAYAASFGVSEWQFDKAETKDLIQLISQFNAVSVRESDGVCLCKKYLNVNSELVLDPTFLLKKGNYICLRNRVNKPEGKRLVSFMLHPSKEKKKMVCYVSNILDARVVDIDIPMKEKGNSYVTPYSSIETWLTEFMDADYVITDSFHGMAFSINFNIPFVTLGNIQGGQARFTSLLKLFDLEKRMTTSEEMIISLLKEQMDWTTVNQKLDNLRSRSMAFLKSVLQ